MADASPTPQTVFVTRRSPLDFVAALAALGLSTYAVMRVLALEEAMKQRSPPESRSVAFEPPHAPEADGESEEDSDLDSIDSLDEEEAPPPSSTSPPAPVPASEPEAAAPDAPPPSERRQRRTKSVSASA